jgi:hypothetical protein
MREIVRYIETHGRGTRKRLAGAAGVTQSDFTHKITQYRRPKASPESTGERFSVEQIGAMSAEAGVGPGWPFVTRRQAAVLAALEEETGRKRE